MLTWCVVGVSGGRITPLLGPIGREGEREKGGGKGGAERERGRERMENLSGR